MTDNNEIQVPVVYDAEFNVVLKVDEALALYFQMEQNFETWKANDENR